MSPRAFFRRAKGSKRSFAAQLNQRHQCFAGIRALALKISTTRLQLRGYDYTIKLSIDLDFRRVPECPSAFAASTPCRLSTTSEAFVCGWFGTLALCRPGPLQRGDFRERTGLS